MIDYVAIWNCTKQSQKDYPEFCQSSNLLGT
jgi:hypothetical protein